MDKLQGNWTKKSILDPKSGEFYNKYFYKRVPAKRVVLDSHKASVLAGYTLIEKDLRSSLIWLNLIIETLSEDSNFSEPKGHIKANYDREKFNLVKGLFVASLTFYGKCFATCEGRKVKLEKSNLDQEFHKEHEEAIEYRNNFAAHSGSRKMERVSVVIALEKKNRVPPYLTQELLQPDTPMLKDLKSFISLFEHAKTFTVNKINTLSKKIYKEEVVAKGYEYWSSKA